MTTVNGHPHEAVLRLQVQQLDDYLDELRRAAPPDSVERVVFFVRILQLLEHCRSPAEVSTVRQIAVNLAEAWLMEPAPSEQTTASVGSSGLSRAMKAALRHSVRT